MTLARTIDALVSCTYKICIDLINFLSLNQGRLRDIFLTHYSAVETIVLLLLLLKMSLNIDNMKYE